MEDQIRGIVNSLIDDFIGEGRVNLVPALTFPLPTITMAYVLSLPSEDLDRFKDWAARVFQVNGDMEAIMELLEYFGEIYDDRLANPRDAATDIASLLLTIKINGEPLREDQFLMLMTELITAGLDTTANGGAHMLWLLGSRTDLRDSLVRDPALIPSAVEEFLRYISPVPASARTVSEACTFGGVEMEPHDKVVLNWISANHDGDEFVSPEDLQLERSPNRHYAFGAGPHRCLGSHLARLELRVLLEAVLQRIPDYQVDFNCVVRYPGIIRGMSALPVTFTPSTA